MRSILCLSQRAAKLTPFEAISTRLVDVDSRDPMAIDDPLFARRNGLPVMLAEVVYR
jgi:hypothetical protein